MSAQASSPQKEVVRSSESEEAVAFAVASDPLELQARLVDLLDANDVATFAASVAPDALIRSLLDPTQAATGREKVMAKVSEIAGKLKGRLAEREAVRVRGDVARCLCSAKVFGTSVAVGFEFVFKGDVVVELGLAKNPPKADFLKTTTTTRDEDAAAAEETTTTTKPLVSLEAPFLAPRPAEFPPRLVEIKVKSLGSPLSSPYIAPRLINPYVKVSCGAGVVARTKVRINAKSPVFEKDDDDATLRLVAPSSDRLDVVVMDYNVARKHQWLAKGSLDLAALPLCATEKNFQLPLSVRKSITNQAVHPDKSQTLLCDIAHFDLARWWEVEERSRRAAQAEAEDASASSSEDGGNSKRTSWWRIWAA
mmetsp:Transcript_19505/g.62675  ORF Transcript_19505/g.62675 Transcript_19505/m.62675 type:complete len:366 (-) Transcript_19505:110-1207(-)